MKVCRTGLRLAMVLLAVGYLSFCHAEPPSLKSAARELFPVGVGISDNIAGRPQDWPLLKGQFSVVTPENCLKPNPVQVAEGNFNFTRADGFVNFAASNSLAVRSEEHTSELQSQSNLVCRLLLEKKKKQKTKLK